MKYFTCNTLQNKTSLSACLRNQTPFPASLMIQNKDIRKLGKQSKVPDSMLIWMRVGISSHCGFAVNNSEIVKAVDLTFCSIK